MRALVIGDIHVRLTGKEFPVTDLPVDHHDIVITTGDIIDENRGHAKSVESGERYEQRGRAFFEHLNDCETPVIAVPGNHDPKACTERLVDGLKNVVVAHRDIVNEASFPHLEADFGGISIAGWGCDEFDFMPAIPAPDYPEIPGIGSEHDGHTADVIARYVERETGRYVAGVSTYEEFRNSLSASESEEMFNETVMMLEERFETITEIVRSAPRPVLLCSHVSPFGVPFDCRAAHSHDGDYHYGSLALKLASLETSPLGVISGHTHQTGLTSVKTGDGYTYLYNPGSPGVTSVEVDAAGVFVTEELS